MIAQEIVRIELDAEESTARRTIPRAAELGCAVTPYIVTTARALT